MRDACYGCFFRAGNLIDSAQQLNSLNDCAKLYIVETEYAECAENLNATIATNNRPIITSPVNIAAGISGGGLNIGIGGVLNYCYSGYCEFVRCIRRLNAQKLISSCYNETLGVRTLSEDLERITFYLNITNCILAKTRCSQYNPITGELQSFNGLQHNVGSNVAALPIVSPVTLNAAAGNIYINKNLAPIYFNALHINEAGELRVLNFPIASTKVTDNFCVRSANMQQSTYGAYNC